MNSRWDRAIKAGKIETPILSCKNGVQSELLRGRACMMFVAMLRYLTLRKQNIIVSLALVSLLMMFDDNRGTVLFISPRWFVLCVLMGPSGLGEEILVVTHAWVFVAA